MQGEKIICALIGLMGAVSNNGKTAGTDNVVRTALSGISRLNSSQKCFDCFHSDAASTESSNTQFAAADSSDAAVSISSSNTNTVINSSDAKPAENASDIISVLSENDIVGLIHEEKFIISPGCASCAAPCGNTSDYDMSQFYQESPEIQNLKLQLLSSAINYAVNASPNEELPELIYRSIAYLGYDLEASAYTSLLAQY